jgi:hypothetical protein
MKCFACDDLDTTCPHCCEHTDLDEGICLLCGKDTEVTEEEYLEDIIESDY